MATVLIVYSTKEGHTEKIVERMRETLMAGGHDVRTAHVVRDSVGIDHDVDAVIVGGPIHKGRHADELVEFARRNRERLNSLSAGFFTVCLSAVESTPESQAATEGYLNAFVAESGWHPENVAVFAGSLAWTHYDFFTTLVMRLIARHYGMPERFDRTQDYDYTDYDAVQAFAEKIASRVETAAGAKA
jgi:menaquinone-dependent protoporphyrinogen oxidase